MSACLKYTRESLPRSETVTVTYPFLMVFVGLKALGHWYQFYDCVLLGRSTSNSSMVRVGSVPFFTNQYGSS